MLRKLNALLFDLLEKFLFLFIIDFLPSIIFKKYSYYIIDDLITRTEFNEYNMMKNLILELTRQNEMNINNIKIKNIDILSTKSLNHSANIFSTESDIINGTVIILIDNKPIFITIENFIQGRYSKMNLLIPIFFYKEIKKKLHIIFDNILKQKKDTVNVYYMFKPAGSSYLNSEHFVESKKEVFKRYLDKSTKKAYKIVKNFLQQREKLEEYDIDYKLSFLFYGPPGTGKTSVIRYIAEKFDINNIFYIEDLKLISRLNAGILQKIKHYDYIEPHIIVFDEIDKLIHNDDGSLNNQKYTGLLNLLEGFSKIENRLIFATTNNIDKLPEALRRVGRFDYIMEINYLSHEDAINFLKKYNLDKEEFIMREIENNKEKLTVPLIRKLIQDYIRDKYLGQENL